MSGQSEGRAAGRFVPDLARYEQPMGVVRRRLTSRGARGQLIGNE
jgi:hypothetical protein